MINRAAKIYFPTSLFAEMFVVMGKQIFPGVQTYRFVGDKIRQTLLFQMNNLPTPITRFYYGPRQKKNITLDFSFPFIAKTPRYSSRGLGVRLVENKSQLDDYLEESQPAYIQQYLPDCKDYRVVIAGDQIIHAYERIARKGEFRANVSQGADLSFKDIPSDVCTLAMKASRICGFNYTGLDICQSNGMYYLLEANMKFGTMGFKKAGLDLKKILDNLVKSSRI